MTRQRPEDRVRSAMLGAVLALYAVAAALLLFWPNGEQVRRLLLDVYFSSINGLGLPSWGGPDGYAAIGNTLLLVPLAFAVTLRAGWRRWWIAIVLCAVISLCVETAQARAGLARVPEWSDVKFNVLGAAAGSLVTAIWLWWRDPQGPPTPPDRVP